MRDGNCTVLTALVLRMRSRFCKTVTAACGTTSNRRGIPGNSDLGRFPPLDSVYSTMHSGCYVGYQKTIATQAGDVREYRAHGENSRCRLASGDVPLWLSEQ